MPKYASYVDRFMEKVQPEPMSGCWLWDGAANGNYGSMSYEGKPREAHRVSWMLFRGGIPDGLYVLHRCDIGCCVNPDHLFVGTQRENLEDMRRKGRQQDYSVRRPNYVKGARHGMAKLTSEDVLAIRASSSPNTELAAKYGVRHTAISRIKTRKRWSHI